MAPEVNSCCLPEIPPEQINYQEAMCLSLATAAAVCTTQSNLPWDRSFCACGRKFSDITGPAGRYELLSSSIFRGSSSDVHLAHDSVTDREVVLKVIGRGPIGDEIILKELEVLQRIKHPNVIRLLDVHVSSSEAVLVTPYLSGGDLLAVIPREQGLPRELVLEFALQLFSALAHLHANGIVHGDVKCENILLTDDRKTLLLCDFGMSDCGNLSSGQDSTPRVLGGTPAYMCPSLIRTTSSPARRTSGGSIDRRPADVWSAGIVLHCMVTGRLPWARASLSDTTFSLYTQGRHRGQEAQRWARMPKVFSALLYRLLCVDVQRRWTASQALECLRNVSKEQLAM